MEEENTKIMKMRKKKGIRGLIDLCVFLPEKAQAVEIGSYAGESAVIFVQSGKIEKLYCVDPWQENYDPEDEASLSKMERVEEAFDERIVPYSKSIVKMKTTSFEASVKFKNETLDFVYIDGNHSYDFVLQDITLWYPKLKKDGILAGHDRRWPGVKKALQTAGLSMEKIFADGSWLCTKK